MLTFPFVFSVCRLFGDVLIFFFMCHKYSHSFEGFLCCFCDKYALFLEFFLSKQITYKGKNSGEIDRDVNFYLLAQGRRRADARLRTVQLQVSSFTWWAWLESMQKSQPLPHTHTPTTHITQKHITLAASPTKTIFLCSSGKKKKSQGGLVNKLHRFRCKQERGPKTH